MQILAIDLGKFKSVACLFDTDSQEAQYKTISTTDTAIEQLLHQTQPNKVVIETCTISGWVYDLCQGQGYAVVVANPSNEAWQWRNVKRKTDKDDGLKLAKLEALGQIDPVHMPTQQMREYRRLVKYRKVLVGRVNQIKNSIRALLDAHGKSLSSRDKAWTQAGMEQLESYRKPYPECSLEELWRGELDVELTLLDTLWQQQVRVDQQLEAMAKQDERVQRLMTIPGVGRRTAEVIATIIDDPQVSAYAGLVPEQRQSGQTNRLGAITKRGSRLLRGALVEIAWMLLRYNPWALTVYQRIYAGQKTRKKTAIVAVARKLLVCCWAMLKHKQDWNPPIVAATSA
jgi:transposase